MRTILFAAALLLGLTLAVAPARADLFMTMGANHVVQNTPLSDCNTRAKTALADVLGATPLEAGTDSGEWLAYGGPADSNAASIHCYPVGNGYVVTFECAVEVPPSPSMATALCTKLDAAFGGKQPS